MLDDDTAPETDSGSLIITAEGGATSPEPTWWPANILTPSPAIDPPAAGGGGRAESERGPGCTGLRGHSGGSARPPCRASLPFVAPPATATTTMTIDSIRLDGGRRGLHHDSADSHVDAVRGWQVRGTTTTTTVPASTTTSPTDNAG